MVLNYKGSTMRSDYDTEQLYLSVSEDGSEAPASSKIGSGGFKFFGLGLQGRPYGSSMSNIFEGSCTEEVIGA